MTKLIPIIEKFSQKHLLSARETTVLGKMISGTIQASEIGAALGISHNTARIHLKRINNKVGVNSKSAVLSEFIRFISL